MPAYYELRRIAQHHWRSQEEPAPGEHPPADAVIHEA